MFDIEPFQSYHLNMTWLKRNLSSDITQLLTQFPIVAIIGPRQCGKTTLAKQICPNWSYFDLENAVDYDRISFDPLLFFSQYPQDLIIDEAQDYPELFKALRGVVDQNPQLRGRFILTGSSSPSLLNHISESLAGRIATVELAPLKANEYWQQELSSFYGILSNRDSPRELSILGSKLSLEQMRHSWLYGGYPAPSLENKLSYWQRWMQEYHTTYLERDIARLFPKLNSINYRRFVQMLAKLSGTILNKSQLAQGLEVSQPSIANYLNIADGTFVWRNLASFESSQVKSIIKMPKGFIRDSGLLHYLLKIHDMDSLMSDPIVGCSFESFVIEELIRGLTAQGVTNCDYYFYRSKAGAEVDLIIKGAFGIIPIEIKYGSFTPLKKLQTLRDFVQKHNAPFGILINQGVKVEQLMPEIWQIPINYL